MEAQSFRRPLYVPRRVIKRNDQLLPSARRVVVSYRRPVPGAVGESDFHGVSTNDAMCKGAGHLNHESELAHVSDPWQCHEQSQSVRVDPWLTPALHGLAEEMPRQLWNVFRSRRQRRHGYNDSREPVPEIRPKRTARGRCYQMLIRGGYNSKITSRVPRSTNRPKDPSFDRTQ